MSDVLTEPAWNADVKTNSKIMMVVVDMQKLSLTEKIIPWQVKAKLTDGVLDITLPKTKPTQQKKSVNVQ